MNDEGTGTLEHDQGSLEGLACLLCILTSLTRRLSAWVVDVSL
jgi:hypothetical protein